MFVKATSLTRISGLKKRRKSLARRLLVLPDRLITLSYVSSILTLASSFCGVNNDFLLSQKRNAGSIPADCPKSACNEVSSVAGCI